MGCSTEKHLARQRVAEPEDQIQVMTAFFQDMGAGDVAFSAPVSHNISPVSGCDIFIGFDAQEFAEFPGVKQRFDFPIERGIAQNKSGGKEIIIRRIRIVDRFAGIDR